ncbi:hypothetical protein Naga_100039g25 [Nannochloropsis gaditana]|uniref:Uncharacterized protein n=1 Tax=Nannochloropsis gaditana TaxID=72520 RepID=W7T4Y6_9STRA|nr:hypothetical protein Naga_100039g25 [Nannochloropsis gaditana]
MTTYPPPQHPLSHPSQGQPQTSQFPHQGPYGHHSPYDNRPPAQAYAQELAPGSLGSSGYIGHGHGQARHEGAQNPTALSHLQTSSPHQRHHDRNPYLVPDYGYH